MTYCLSYFWLSETPERPGSIYRGAGCTRVTTWALLRPTEQVGVSLKISGSHRATLQFDVGVDILALSTHLDHVSERARDRGAQVISSRTRHKGPWVSVLSGAEANDSEDPRRKGGKTQVLHALSNLYAQWATSWRGTAVIVVGDFNAEPEEAAIKTLINDVNTNLRTSQNKVCLCNSSFSLQMNSCAIQVFILKRNSHVSQMLSDSRLEAETAPPPGRDFGTFPSWDAQRNGKVPQSWVSSEDD